jgi:PadR family transcriptional regulator PadR
VHTPELDIGKAGAGRAAQTGDQSGGDAAARGEAAGLLTPVPMPVPGSAAGPLSGNLGPAPEDDASADDGTTDASGVAPGSGAPSIATSCDPSGAPVHRGWLPVSGHHRWLEPFVLMALAGGSAHGYAIVASLTQVGASESALDVGQVYRTLRDLEQSGQISSTWATGTGPARRDYVITPLGERALDEWSAVMRERGRLIAEFDATYLGWLAARHSRRQRAERA